MDIGKSEKKRETFEIRKKKEKKKGFIGVSVIVCGGVLIWR